MNQSQLGEVGRIRQGRVDTGEQVYNNARMVSAELIRRALTNAGFGLDNAHWHTQQRDGAQKKYVVSLVFTASDKPIPEYDRKTTEAFRDLASTAWFCHVWLNPNGVVTINFVGVQQGEPLSHVTVRDGVLGIGASNSSGDKFADGIALEDVKTILVKFFFTNPTRIPPGIERVERSPNAEMDQRHAAEVAK